MKLNGVHGVSVKTAPPVDIIPLHHGPSTGKIYLEIEASNEI